LADAPRLGTFKVSLSIRDPRGNVDAGFSSC
jgi:hypothetical protein